MPLTFLERSPKAILDSLIADYQTSSGKVLYPAQVEMLLMHILAYREALLRNDIQHSAEQNLIAYAIGNHLDELGANLQIPRLLPVPARCKAQFTLDAPSQLGCSIAAGTRVTTKDGKHSFETTDPAYIISGQLLSNEVLAQCTLNGVSGNGIKEGIVCELDPKIEGVSVVNTSDSEGGGDLESDSAYRERLLLSPARFGGGSADAYRLWALTANGEVADALADNAENRGDINIYILSRTGEPSDELCQIVEDFCNKDGVRMIGDKVKVIPAIRREYSIRAEVTVYANQDADILLDRVRGLASAYAKLHSARLGADVTPTQVLLALAPVVEGLYNVNLIEPHEAIEIGPAEWADATKIEITLAGYALG